MRNFPIKAATGLTLLSVGIALFGGLRADNIAGANQPKLAKTAAVLGQPFEVTLGESTSIKAQKLEVSFERVTEDSRCPKDVDCVWAGQIGVVVGLKKSAKKLGETTLIVQGSSIVTPKSIGEVGGYWVKLLEVTPEKGPQNAPGSAQKIKLLVQTKPFDAPENSS